MKTGNPMGSALALAALCFLYGIVHAVGPGHGKAIISSYVVANEETVRRGVLISFIAAGLQALTAIVLVGVLLIGLNATGLQGQCLVEPAESELRAHRGVGLYLLSAAWPTLAGLAGSGASSRRAAIMVTITITAMTITPR